MSLTVNRGAQFEYEDPETGKKYFSVSQVRACMWEGFRFVKPDVLAAAQRRGTLLHRRFALCLGARLDLCAYPPILKEYPGYCDSMDRFIDDYQPEAERIEEPSKSDKWGVAGCPDGLLKITSVLSITDLKSGDETPVDPCQLLGYHELDDYRCAERMLDVYLNKHGKKPEVKEIKRREHLFDWAAFVNALHLLKWRVKQ